MIVSRKTLETLVEFQGLRISNSITNRSALVTAARAHDIQSSLDMVTTSFKGEESKRHLELECADGKRLGFNGKQLIHPSQIEIAQKVFSPSEEELTWTINVTIGDAKVAVDQGRGAWTLDGKLTYVPVVRMAHATVAKAEACGIDMQSLKETWKSLQPQWNFIHCSISRISVP